MFQQKTTFTPQTDLGVRLLDAVTDRDVYVQGVAQLIDLVDAKQVELLQVSEHVKDIDEMFRLAFFGSIPGAIIGYAAYQLYEAQSLSDLFCGEDEGFFDSWFDLRGAPVASHQVRLYEGFSEYSRSGDVLFLDKFEIVRDRQGQGHGTEFLAQLISLSQPELVFVHACNRQAEKFFSEQGFVSAEIVNGNSEELVMVFNNPEFLR